MAERLDSTGTTPSHLSPIESAELGEPAVSGLVSDAWYELRRNPVFIVSAIFLLIFGLMAVFPSLFTRLDPRDCSLLRSVVRPNATHWFGTDIQGCDYYARVIYGARASMAVGLLAVGAETLIGVVLGTISGWYGRAVDTVVSRLADVWLALPLILGALVVLSVIEERNIVIVALTLAIFTWPVTLRIVRGQVIAARGLDYVQAARALGVRTPRLLVRHVLPNALPPVIVFATITVGAAIGAEAALSFLGIGLQLPAISWGLMIETAQSRMATDPHLLVFPTLFLSVAVLACVLLGESLRDAFDPKADR